MFKLHDAVRLKEDNEKYGVPASAIGAIVDIQGNGDAYCVEFIDENGETYEDALCAYFSESDLKPARW